MGRVRDARTFMSEDWTARALLRQDSSKKKGEGERRRPAPPPEWKLQLRLGGTAPCIFHMWRPLVQTHRGYSGVVKGTGGEYSWVSSNIIPIEGL